MKAESKYDAPPEKKQRIEFEYDWQGRRVKQTVWRGAMTTTEDPNYFYWTAPAVRKYVYDAWNLIAELDGNNNVVQSYLWGLDLSGTAQGAGGVGGLVAVKPGNGIAGFVALDGNGNVVGLVTGSAGPSVNGAYEYGPFGEPIRVTGAMGKANPFRWSTKFTDDETDLVYYGARYYNASTGRWLNRDPLEEIGGPNLYAFVGNNPISYFDRNGLEAGSNLGVAVHDQIMAFINEFSPYQYAWTTGMRTYAVNLLKLTPEITFVVKNLGDKSGRYVKGSRQFQGPFPGINQTTVFHEMTHAFNDIIVGLGAVLGDRKDEGAAYAIEKYVEMSSALRDLQIGVEGTPCNYKGISRSWRSFWAVYGQIPGNGWGGGRGFFGNFTLQPSDIDNVAKWTGVRLSCPRLAALVNQTLSDQHCCFRVRCRSADAAGRDDIVPTQDVSPTFMHA